jgi:murein DD-endopeptidase MepM/ murein hydrolase activator NlpD
MYPGSVGFSKNKLFRQLSFLMTVFICLSAVAFSESTVQKALRVLVDLNIGDSQKVKLSNGETVDIKLLEVVETRDDVRSAVRTVKVKVAVDGKELTLISANYNLPVTSGKVQIDCPITKGYYKNSNKDRWGLEKDARFRIWPAGSPFITPGKFEYPVKQRWLVDDTQMSNEPTFVDWGEEYSDRSIYYHSGLDFGGSEGLTEIVFAADGLVISANGEILSGYDDFPGDVRTDVVYIIDDWGWYYRYSHLSSVDPAIKIGKKVKMGQKVGLLGKEGHSGGWTHLHFEIKHKQTPSGKWSTEDGYVYIWEAYIRQYNPPLIAIARPHHLVWTEQTVTLDGTKSKSFAGEIVKYEWIFYDGTTASGPIQEIKYKLPGTYSEVLKIVDSKGNIDYDYSVVQVRDKANPDKMPPSIHANYYPSLNIKPGDPVTFKVRTFQTEFGNEVWDFGDGTPTVTVKSEKVNRKDPRKGKYAETIHSFDKPGHYIVRVERSDENGFKAIAHLHVEVGM